MAFGSTNINLSTCDPGSVNKLENGYRAGYTHTEAPSTTPCTDIWSQPALTGPVAEPQAEAMNRFVVPQLATKPDLERLEASLTLRMVAIVATLDGLLFTLLKLTATL